MTTRRIAASGIQQEEEPQQAVKGNGRESKRTRAGWDDDTATHKLQAWRLARFIRGGWHPSLLEELANRRRCPKQKQLGTQNKKLTCRRNSLPTFRRFGVNDDHYRNLSVRNWTPQQLLRHFERHAESHERIPANTSKKWREVYCHGRLAWSARSGRSEICTLVRAEFPWSQLLEGDRTDD